MSLVIAVALVMLLLAAGLGGDRLLASASWTERYPALALRAWMGLALTCYLAVPAALLALAHDVLEHALMWALHADKDELHEQYASGAVSVAWNGTALVAVGLAALVVGVVVTEHARLVVERRTLRRDTTLREMVHPGCSGTPLILVPDPRPAAWCCAGRHRAVYVTEGAASSLRGPALAALIAHESAHLKRHHHRYIFGADVAGRLAARVGLLRNMRARVRLLVELDADDVAVAQHGRAAVMRALLAVSRRSGSIPVPVPVAVPVPHGGMLLMAGSVGPRVRRLVSDPLVGERQLKWWQRQLAQSVVLTVAASPVVALLLPGLLVAGTAH
jgi:hypothetical protein